MSNQQETTAFGFPWKRSIWLTLGLMLVSYVLLEIAPLAPLALYKFTVHLLGSFAPSIPEYLHAHKQFVSAALEEVLYLTAFGSAIGFLKMRFFPGTSIRELTNATFGSLRGKFWSCIGTAVLGLAAATVINALTYQFLPLPTPDSPAGDFAMKLTGPAFMIFAVGAIVIAPICEELLCRGFLFNMLRGSLRRNMQSKWALRIADAGAVLLSGAFFAGMHGTLTGFPGLFITGCVLAVVYQRRNTLYASIFMHSMNNIMATIALYAAIHH